MHKQVSYKIVSLVFGILVLCFAIAFYAVGWTEPSVAPPGGNVSAPLNVSNVGQTKVGGLALNTGADGIVSSDGAAFGLLIYDGNVGIGTTNPSNGTGGQLKLDVEGPVGATKYCDKDGNNCKTITEMGGGGPSTNCRWVNCGGEGWTGNCLCNNDEYMLGVQKTSSGVFGPWIKYLRCCRFQ